MLLIIVIIFILCIFLFVNISVHPFFACANVEVNNRLGVSDTTPRLVNYVCRHSALWGNDKTL